MHQPGVETTVTSVYRNLCATVEHLCLYLYLYLDPYPCPFPCPYVFLYPYPCLYLCLFLCLFLFPCLCPCLSPGLCLGSGGSCDGCVQYSDPLCGVSVVEYAGDVCAAGCVHCAPVRSPPQHMAGCFHDDVGGGGGDGVGGYCCDDGGYEPGSYSKSPPRPPLGHRPPRHPSPRACTFEEALRRNPCSTVFPCHLKSGCAGRGCGAPSAGGGGDGDGGGCAGVFLAQSSGAALPPLSGPPQRSAPEPGLKGAHGLDGSPVSLSS